MSQAANHPPILGFFDSFGNACLKFHLCGVRHPLPGVEYSGIIDTGFTGFLQAPIQEAFSLGLPLEGTTTISLADGSSVVSLTALAKATLLGRTEVGTVILSFNSEELLVGMDFLRRFKRALVVSQSAGVVLVEDSFSTPTSPRQGNS